MSFPFINNPKTGKPDEMVTVVMLSSLAVAVRFLLDGVSLSLKGYTVHFGHIDAAVYLAILAPVLGAHSFIRNKKKEESNADKV